MESIERQPLQDDNRARNLDEVFSKLDFGKFHVKMLIFTCGAYFAACAQMMLIVFLSSPIKSEWDLSDMMFPFLPFSCGISSFIASFVFGSLSDRIGRQTPLLVAIALVVAFGIGSAFPKNFWLFVALRSLASCGTSGIENVNFVLLLEFLPQKKRGSIMVVITLCGALGAVYTSAMAWVLLKPHGWRWFVVACTGPACLVFVYRLWFRYESPRFLYVSGRHEEGMHVLEEIARQNNVILPPGEILCPPTEKRGRIQDLFDRSLQRRTFFCSVVWFLQSLGYWGVTMYLPEYLSTKVSVGMDPSLNMFGVFLGQIPGLLLAMVLIEPDKLGRIKCLRFYSFFTISSLLLFAFIDISVLKACFVILVYLFMVPIYSILNTFTPEVYPTDTRGIALAWMYMVIAFPGLVTAFIGASVLSTNITWFYPTLSAAIFALQLLFSFGLNIEPGRHGLVDNKSDAMLCEQNGLSDSDVLAARSNDELPETNGVCHKNGSATGTP
ncbi:synaptic vesicle 2-related protein-like [Dreissena polymorpha]|uniref:Major facilitator superfamily (MFS) profile domain-containing protein n=1 Tax=Dreissena polymorpha TaxID=45954 RepID=A0A9D4MYJ3_DREPO|nr:synaptic vesicle 2-related protein-like [Dreissena polymorpha]KAH3884119.1 hypothetical protein DPMN_008092 [Dreissena polymorpha]